MTPSNFGLSASSNPTSNFIIAPSTPSSSASNYTLSTFGPSTPSSTASCSALNNSGPSVQQSTPLSVQRSTPPSECDTFGFGELLTCTVAVGANPLSQEKIKEIIASPTPEGCSQAIELPKQLETVRRAADFPPERHRWNTNEEVAALLIAFDHHAVWETKDVRLRPPSGTMLLYSRKKVRYRKDGFCWKKRKDGKTTREDHMKLKVQGIECIYGCYVHSAILPTFHRRCYWLLQNPDIVLVHYLNVPLTNDNKLCCLPPISLQLDCRDWSRKDLVSQLRPMFASVKHFDVTNNVEEVVEKAIESVVGHLLNRSDSGCPSNTCPKGGTSTANQGIIMFQATTVGPTPLVSTPVQSHILQFVYGQQPPQQGQQQQQQQQQQQGQQLQQQPDARLSRTSSLSTIDQNVCDNATTSGSSAAIHQMAPPHNNPLILNLSQLPGGSNSLLILSSQSLAEQVSILNSTDTMSMLNSVESNSVASFNNSTANDNIASSGSQGPCYDVAEYLNCHDLSIEFDLLEEGLKKEARCERCDGMRIVQEHSNATVAPLGHLSMPETVRVTVSESVFEGSIHEMRNNHFHSCSKRLRKAIPEYSKCLADDIDNHISSTVRCCNPVELRSEELIMDELEDILHIVNESFDDSAELNGSFDNSELVDDQIAMADAYGHCAHDRATMSTLSSSSNQFSDMNRSKEEPESGPDHQLSGKKNSSEVNNGNDNYDEITDFCPEWSYTEGGTKVLVTGPWEHPTSSYSVLFDNISAPTAVVQRGVLRCYAPAHGPAVVCLQVACNGQIISTPKFFEYKSHEELVVAKHKEWFDVEDGELRDSLVKRLVQIGEKLDFKEELSSHKLNADASEQDLINLVKDCSLRIWMTDSLLPTSLKNGLSLLHLAAGLGYHRLIVSLVQWRTDSHSLVLDYEVDSLCTDSDGNTPLMWACAKGQADAAIFLYHWNPGVLNIPNISGCYPLSLLRQRGYPSIADHLEHLKTSTSENYNCNSLQKPDEENQPDIDWIQNSLKTESWMKNETLTRSVAGESANNTAVEDDWNGSNGETIRWPTDDDVNLPFQRSAKGLRAPTIFGSSNIFTSAMKRTRLMKRTSVDILPDYPQFRSDPSKFSKSDSVNNSQGSGGNTSEDQHAMPVVASAVLRTSNSDPHLNSHMRSCSSSSGDPMISMIDRDLNSPILFLHSSISIDEDDNGLGLEQESVAMEMGSTERLVDADVLSQEDSEMLQTASVEAAEDSTSLIHSNQMMTLASQIIAAMPERIKVSPNQSKQLLMDEINARRDRSSSYGSFSSCSSSTPPVCQAEDSGISTPLEGMSSFLDYRYVDIGTPASTLSPTSTCMQSPYRFDIDSPPPTTAEFTEYFNAPATFMEKDFSQLTLSDEEQRRLYEAAKIIQSFFRKYKDKKDHQTRQQQKEIEAAILIQSYYRRYKQFMYYKRMTQAAVLIQSQFRSYYAQKCFRRSREAATIIQNRYRAYKEHERFKKSRNAAVIIQQRFRKHYQRTLASKQAALANTVHKMMADSDLKGGIAEDSNVVTDKSRNFTETRPDDTADVKKVGDKEPDKSVECKNESDMEARNDIDESQLDISEGRS